jgi:protein-L-isoaspartate(D-aspartate) O-methyltransferase
MAHGRASGSKRWTRGSLRSLSARSSAARSLCQLPLPIGFEKTISQPFIVALMTDLLDIGAEDTVLEIGTGLGYQAAILAQLARKVYSIEIIEELARQAKQRLRQQGCTNIELKIANGYHGWSEHAPFDKVIVTAAPETDVLARLPDHPAKRLADLLPWNWPPENLAVEAA